MTDEIVQVIFSEKAYLGIVAETYERIGTETGGIFLGRYFEGVWYVLETLDPGPQSVFKHSFFEYDDAYITHLANKVERFYKQGLELIGLWHRHPGGYDSFSSTDDGTNQKYSRLHPEGAISCLVNLDPDFRLTVYHVDNPLRYQKLKFAIDDSKIPEEFLEQKTFHNYLPQSSLSGTERNRGRHKTNLGNSNSRSQVKEKANGKPGVFVYGLLPILFGRVAPNTQENLQEEIVDEILVAFDSELNYLDKQTDYEYTLTISGENALIIHMEYLHSIEGYPACLEFLFGLDRKGKRFVGIDGKYYRYKENYIQDYLMDKIRFTQ